MPQQLMEVLAYNYGVPLEVMTEAVHLVVDSEREDGEGVTVVHQHRTDGDDDDESMDEEMDSLSTNDSSAFSMNESSADDMDSSSWFEL